MYEKTRDLICELEDVMIALYRSAGNLDEMIQVIKKEVEDYPSDDYLELIVKAQKMYREDVLTNVCSAAYKEEDVWFRYFHI